MHFFREMQFASHCYTLVSCQAPSRLSVYKNSVVYLSGARVIFFSQYAFWVPRLNEVLVDDRMKLGMDCAVRCLRIRYQVLVFKDKLLLNMNIFGQPPFFTNTQYVAKEITRRYNYPHWELVFKWFSASNFVLFHFCLISVMSGRSHGYLGIINTFFGVHVSCSRTQLGNPCEDRTPTLSLTTKPIRNFEVLLIFINSFINIHDCANETIFI